MIWLLLWAAGPPPRRPPSEGRCRPYVSAGPLKDGRLGHSPNSSLPPLVRVPPGAVNGSALARCPAGQLRELWERAQGSRDMLWALAEGLSVYKSCQRSRS